MTTHDQRRQQLRAAFTAELDERVRALHDFLLRLERANPGGRPSAELLDGLFREARSLKGAARAVGLPRVERLAHSLESDLGGVRRSEVLPDATSFDAAYRTVDALKRAGRDEPPTDRAQSHITGGSDARRPADESRRAESDAEVGQAPLGPARSTGSAAASSSPPGVPSELVQAPVSGRTGDHAEGAARAAPDSVRVAVGKLDALLSQAGELAITHTRIERRLGELRELRRDVGDWRREWRASRGVRSTLRHTVATVDRVDASLPREIEGLLRFMERAEERTQALLERVEALAAQFRQDAGQLGLVTRAIEDEVMAVRLLPVGTMFGPFERMVRDLTRQKGKQARLVLDGAETELDRKILEQLRDPIMHMLRNAVDHGIETPAERRARGKPEVGTIRFTASQRGGIIELELSDDGAGLDPALLRESAVRRGLLTEEQASALDDAAAVELIFRPGFSTTTTVTETSGRGVGMDVVHEHLERLDGLVEAESAPGQGTRFRMRVPLTLATSRALLVELGGQVFAVPAAAVERTGRLPASGLVSLEGRRAVPIEGHPVVALELASVLERTPSGPDIGDAPDRRAFLVLRQGERRVALLVDRLVGEQAIVVKRLGWPLRRVRNVGGATVLGSGDVVVILNPADLLKSASRLQRASGSVAAPVAPADRRRHRLLVADDSVTTRTLLRSILEGAGYDVAVALDGVEALSLLRDQPADLVVSDVEMPRLDGFELTAEIRRDERLRETPVILVTSLAAPEHRERGVAAGADAYIVKSGFDQSQLLEAIRRLL